MNKIKWAAVAAAVGIATITPALPASAQGPNSLYDKDGAYAFCDAWISGLNEQLMYCTRDWDRGVIVVRRARDGELRRRSVLGPISAGTINGDAHACHPGNRVIFKVRTASGDRVARTVLVCPRQTYL